MRCDDDGGGEHGLASFLVAVDSFVPQPGKKNVALRIYFYDLFIETVRFYPAFEILKTLLRSDA